MNRLAAVLDAALKTTQYAYDAKGNLTRVIDAKNQTTTFSYDELDRLISATNPLGLAESFVYDTNGNLTSTTNRNGQTIAFNYDALNRLTSKIRPPAVGEVGNQTTTFFYDSVGNLTRISNPVIDVLNQYDLANRLQSSVSGPEQTAAQTVVQINADTVISENNRQFEGRRFKSTDGPSPSTEPTRSPTLCCSMALRLRIARRRRPKSTNSKLRSQERSRSMPRARSMFRDEGF